jgi:hypothetical protein
MGSGSHRMAAITSLCLLWGYKPGYIFGYRSCANLCEGKYDILFRYTGGLLTHTLSDGFLPIGGKR